MHAFLAPRGVGLCRTEHMFLGPRRAFVERLVLAENDSVQRGVIAEMEPLQRADFGRNHDGHVRSSCHGSIARSTASRILAATG
ncbi:MAG: hypothetical protein WDO06_00540 [Actinomycetota bacterium]